VLPYITYLAFFSGGMGQIKNGTTLNAAIVSRISLGRLVKKWNLFDPEITFNLHFWIIFDFYSWFLFFWLMSFGIFRSIWKKWCKMSDFVGLIYKCSSSFFSNFFCVSMSDNLFLYKSWCNILGGNGNMKYRIRSKMKWYIQNIKDKR
jgi:hypothetical protein